MAAKQSSGVIAVRSRDMLIGAPGALGFNNLLEPDKDAAERFGSDLKFNAKVAYEEAATERMAVIIDKMVDGLWPQLMDALKDAKKAEPKGGWVKPTGEAWLGAHLKEPTEQARVQLPSIQWSNKAEFKAKDGSTMTKTMRAYDAKNHELDLKELHLGMGSIIQPVLIPGLYVSPLLNKGQPDISFKLQGVRVLKLERYGAGGPSLGEIDEADMALLGEDVEVEDLGSYAAQAPAAKPKVAAGGLIDEDDLPF